MKYTAIISLTALAVLHGVAARLQPYVDIAKASYAYSPKQGLNEKRNPLLSNFCAVSITLPVELKKGGDAIVVNPFFDHNQGSVSNRSFEVESGGLNIGLLKKLDKKKWSLFSAFIVRRNKETGEAVDNPWQYGGVLLATRSYSPRFSVKFGLYYNREFFGNFFMPLAGIDWQINKKNALFGVLPGSMIFQRRVSTRFGWGGLFRTLTNSYRLPTVNPCQSGDCGGRDYLRVNDNQLGIFADFYITPKIVLTGEGGYTISRKYRFGIRGTIIHSFTDLDNDNAWFRASLAYRFRLR